MNHMIYYLSQPSYCMQNNTTKIVTTVQAACIMPYFTIDGREYAPLWVAPWHAEKPSEINGNFLTVCRGNFIHVSRTEDMNKPEHGWCCNTPWALRSVEKEGSVTEMVLTNDAEFHGGVIEKSIRIVDDIAVVYEDNILSGFDGDYSIAKHPCLRVPEKKENGHFAFTKPIEGYTASTFTETPEQGAYMLCERSLRITDVHNIKTIYGDTIDLAYHPARKGTFEIMGFVNDQSEPYTFAALTNREEGYIYYQLCKTSRYPYKLMWLFNGGRHYFPWNGTKDGCLGVEDMLTHMADMPNETNPETGERKYNVTMRLYQDKQYSFKQIYGLVQMPNDYDGVAAIKCFDEHIEIIGLDGSVIAQNVNCKYLDD